MDTTIINDVLDTAIRAQHGKRVQVWIARSSGWTQYAIGTFEPYSAQRLVYTLERQGERVMLKSARGSHVYQTA